MAIIVGFKEFYGCMQISGFRVGVSVLISSGLLR